MSFTPQLETDRRTFSCLAIDDEMVLWLTLMMTNLTRGPVFRGEKVLPLTARVTNGPSDRRVGETGQSLTARARSAGELFCCVNK